MLQKTVIFLCLGVGLLASQVQAEEETDQGIISYRQHVMKSAAAHLNAAKYIFKDRLELSGHLQKHANALVDFATLIPDLFPQDSDFGDTDAKAEIWEKPPLFKEKVQQLDQAVKAFAVAPTEKTFAAVGKACKSCHDEFREK